MLAIRAGTEPHRFIGIWAVVVDGRVFVRSWSLKPRSWYRTFREDPVGRFIDWHPAPRRQFVIILSGQLEIGFSDGTKQVFGPGDARLVEDTTGKGHTTRVHGSQPCMTATIPLAQQ